ncbi:hypothetical protein CORC01_01423 [Colletotrichum orchidophilum]|uniref:Uncharacterized protein n=1 Tax=Colletotrichum orchidophilum TaxID=1209926 RepID=A0A1G4BPH7_9PEZI|nr:uncharacterized protein CORC01_01423 [Colletotrichum orchidophilum]OHF03370.1 hypothetical protein CORC01_01423 [Colletotrichum orchidophilum]
MGRSRRRGPDDDLDPYESYGRPYDTAADPYAQNPSRGRSPGPRRRNKSEPAAAPAVYDDYQRDPESREQPRNYRESRKYSRDIVPESHAPQSDQREDRKSRKNRYYDQDTYQPRARSHGRSAREAPVTAHHRADEDAFDAFAPASRRGRERQHAYHPPRTSDTRRSKYADFDAEPRYSERRRSRYADYDEADPYNAELRRSRNDEPRESDRRRSRYPEYEGVPRGGSESNRGRHLDSEVDPRSNPRGYAGHGQGGRGRYMNDSPERYVQPGGGGQQRSARGRSMPRKGAAGGASGAARPRAKSAVGYAALGEAAQTAFRVGSQAALQMKSEPGPWIGEKGTRVATAALGAALVDTFVGHKATGIKGGMRHQALRQACEMGIRNFVVQPTVNTATRRSGSWGGHGGGSGGGQGSSGRRRQ